MDKQHTLFAFRLAESASEPVPGGTELDAHVPSTQWKAHDGVAAAGCTDYRFPGNLRAYSQVLGNDRGLYC
ncbi:MAG: hypothetical protein JNM58_15675 [Xanthomonadaceae bacterium]|nr:hypothetical protein [Xanthomonadaceae bacterium]